MVMILTRPLRIWARVFSRRSLSNLSCARAWLASSSKDSSKRMAFLYLSSALHAAKKADACLCLAALRRAFRVQIRGLRDGEADILPLKKSVIRPMSEESDKLAGASQRCFLFTRILFVFCSVLFKTVFIVLF